MTKQPLNRRDQAFCLGLAKVLIEPLREVARNHGYALAEHGSQRRDIDLIAVPWVEDAAPPPELAEALRIMAQEVVGIAINIDRQGAANPAYFDEGAPGSKPHGRLCWAFHLGGGPYVDLSVIPPRDPPYETVLVESCPEGTAK